MLREPGDNHQKTGIATGQDLERPDLALAHHIAADHLPQTTTFFGTQRFQIDNSKQLKKRLFRIIQTLKSTRRSSQQHNPRLGRQRVAQLPAKIVIHIFAERLQIFDHENEFFPQPIRRVQNSIKNPIRERLLAPAIGQIGMRLSQLPREIGIVPNTLPRKVEQGIEPKIGDIEYLLTLFHKSNRQKTLGKFLIGIQLRRNPREQHSLSLPPRCDHQNMLVQR